jgi:type II secretory pathway component PulC
MKRTFALALVVFLGSMVSVAAQAKGSRPASQRVSSESLSNGAVVTLKYRAPVAKKSVRAGARLAPLVSAKDKNRLEGFRVKQVLRGSVFEEMTLRKGDILTHINGVKLTKMDDLRMFEGVVRKGGKIELTISRNGELHAMNIYRLPSQTL